MTFQTEDYGRYEIKSGPLKGAWAANAFRRKVRVANATGASRDEAVATVKAALDRLDAIDLAERDVEGAPSARAYEQAFAAILPTLADSYVAMLKAHLAAPDHLISATKLAEAAGYAGYEGANLHYGKLGYAIADEIGFVPPKREDGTEIWTCAIARDPALDIERSTTTEQEGLARGMDSGQFEWQMRPQVVQALQALGFLTASDTRSTRRGEAQAASSGQSRRSQWALRWRRCLRLEMDHQLDLVTEGASTL